MSIFCRTHIAVGHRIQGGRPGPLRLPSAAGSLCNILTNADNKMSSNDTWFHSGQGEAFGFVIEIVFIVVFRGGKRNGFGWAKDNLAGPVNAIVISWSSDATITARYCVNAT